MDEIFFGSSWEGSRVMTMTSTTMTTKVTTMITTTKKTLAELNSKMQYFAAMHECSTLVYIINKQTLLELNYPSWNDQAVNNFF